MDKKQQINFQLSDDDAKAVDQMAETDGFDNRSAWMRRLVRQEIERRKALDVVAVREISNPVDGSAERIPVIVQKVS
jgi:metal-responsive CopG/Arc/MetJ family transcriptional regulator